MVLAHPQVRVRRDARRAASTSVTIAWCWPLEITTGRMNSLRRNARITGTSLIASGRVPDHDDDGELHRLFAHTAETMLRSTGRAVITQRG